MEEIYIIGSDPLLENLGYSLITLPSLRDDEIHEWVVRELSNKTIDKLIIEVGSEPIKAIQIALHVRLSLNELSNKTLIPILFISLATLNKVMADSGEWSHLFATKGTTFTSYANAKAEVAVIEGLKYDEYRTKFLNIINVRPDETIGRHSLANQWGAYVMDKAAKANAVANHPELQKAKISLYFKFVAAHNYEYQYLNPNIKKPVGSINLGGPDRIVATNKKILLIDDEADKGWETVLRAVFKTSQPGDFQVINRKISDFNSLSIEEKELIESGNFDLFLVDLRLNGVAEETLSNPNEFSGTKILKKIKELNKGNQVIMFTASNKAWNMKSLLDAGADGYYIKESPEYNFPAKFSEENYSNFKNEVNSSFELSFLRQIYAIHARCEHFIENDKSNRLENYKRFYSRAVASLDIAFELLKKSANNKKYLNLAYLSYYHILEDYANQTENFKHERDTNDVYINTNCLVIDGHTNEWKLKFIKGESETNRVPYNFFKIEDNINDKPWTSLAKVSFILVFKFNQGDQELQDWGRLNEIRNSKAGHGNNRDAVTISEVFELLKLVELFLTNP
jgi:CheY-like chemotaxis protein